MLWWYAVIIRRISKLDGTVRTIMLWQENEPLLYAGMCGYAVAVAFAFKLQCGTVPVAWSIDSYSLASLMLSMGAGRTRFVRGGTTAVTCACVVLSGDVLPSFSLQSSLNKNHPPLQPFSTL